jgi:hypothetical protein
MRNPSLQDTLVILKGSQLNLVHHQQSKERLPVSAGLPSAGGLYRSKSSGGDRVVGIAADMKLLTDLLTNSKRELKERISLKPPLPPRKRKKVKSVKPKDDTGSSARPKIILKQASLLESNEEKEEISKETKETPKERPASRWKSMPTISSKAKEVKPVERWASMDVIKKPVKSNTPVIEIDFEFEQLKISHPRVI